MLLRISPDTVSRLVDSEYQPQHHRALFPVVNARSNYQIGRSRIRLRAEKRMSLDEQYRTYASDTCFFCEEHQVVYTMYKVL